MYNPTITVKSKDVEERSVYLTYLRDKEKNEVRMCKMDNEEQLEHGLYLLLDKNDLTNFLPPTLGEP